MDYKAWLVKMFTLARHTWNEEKFGAEIIQESIFPQFYEVHSTAPVYVHLFS